MVYYIADLHFGHTNAIKFDNRPFENIHMHDFTISTLWNETVKPDDDVYILGDISWYSADKTVDIFNNLNGVKHLIIGNHDHKLLRNQNVRDLFVEITDYKEIKDENKNVILSHYPIPSFNKHYYGAYHFYGHVHNSEEWRQMELVKRQMIEKLNKPCNMINVGLMMPYMNYEPKTFKDIVSGYEEHKPILDRGLRCSKS